MARNYFESREHRELRETEITVCRIPAIIGVLDE